MIQEISEISNQREQSLRARVGPSDGSIRGGRATGRPGWKDTHLIRSNMASTVLTSGLLPVLSISSTFWDTPGLMLTTSTMPVAKESITEHLEPSRTPAPDPQQCLLLRTRGHGGSRQHWKETLRSSQDAEPHPGPQQRP